MNRIIVFYYAIYPLDLIGSNRIVCNLSRGKNALLCLIDEAIELIKTEMRIVNLRIKYPDQQKKHINKLPLSPLFLTDNTVLIHIMELVSSLFLSKRITYQNGKSAYLTDLGKGFEWLFNIKLGDYHQKHEDVIKWKSTKLTEFLNELAMLIRKEHENKGYR